MVLIGVGEALSPGYASAANMLQLLKLSSFLGIVSIGQTLVILAGGIDLSVAWVLTGAAFALTTVTRGQNSGILTGLLAALAVGAGVAKLRISKSRTLLAGGGHPGGCKRMTGDGIVRDLSRHRPSPRKSPLHSRAGPTFRRRVTGKPQQLHRRRRRRLLAPAGLGGRRQIPGTLVVGETAAEFVAAGCRFL